MGGGLQPLDVPGFGRLLVSYLINELGDSIALVALSVLVYDRTRDPLATTALFIAAKFLPALLAPLITARVDQLAARRVLPALYVIEALAFVGLAALAEDFLLVLVLVLALVDGTLALVGRGLTRGLTAALLSPRGQLREGNALLNIAFGAASVVGLAAGGLVVAGSSVQTALLLDAGSFALIALLIATARGLPRPASEPERFARRLRAGLGFARRSPPIRVLLSWQAVALLFFTLVIPIEVVYAKETLGVGDAGFGALIASWSAGIVVGSLLFVRVRERPPAVLVLASTAAVGAGYTGLAAVDTLLPACLFSVLGGIGNGVQWVSVMTLLQEHTPVDLQARVAGLLESIGAAVPGAGYLLGGALTSLASPPAAYAVAGAGTLLLVGSALLVPGPMRALASHPGA